MNFTFEALSTSLSAIVCMSPIVVAKKMNPCNLRNRICARAELVPVIADLPNLHLVEASVQRIAEQVLGAGVPIRAVRGQVETLLSFVAGVDGAGVFIVAERFTKVAAGANEVTMGEVSGKHVLADGDRAEVVRDSGWNVTHLHLGLRGCARSGCKAEACHEGDSGGAEHGKDGRLVAVHRGPLRECP